MKAMAPDPIPTIDLVSRKGNSVVVRLIAPYYDLHNTEPTSFYVTKTSPEYLIFKAAKFETQISMFKYERCQNSRILTRTYIRVTKLHKDDGLLYEYDLSSSVHRHITGKRFITDDAAWVLFYEADYIVAHGGCPPFIKVTVSINLVAGPTSFAPLYEDSEATDCELKGEDGSVHVHRAVLMASSPMLKRMLSGPWRESSEGCINVPDTSKITLQSFKDYLYLQTLPETGLEQLLLLASYYMMPVLEKKCVFQLMVGLTADNLNVLLEFSMNHRVPKLFIGIMECVQSGAVDIAELSDHFNDLENKKAEDFADAKVVDNVNTDN